MGSRWPKRDEDDLRFPVGPPSDRPLVEGTKQCSSSARHPPRASISHRPHRLGSSSRNAFMRSEFAVETERSYTAELPVPVDPWNRCWSPCPSTLSGVLRRSGCSSASEIIPSCELVTGPRSYTKRVEDSCYIVLRREWDGIVLEDIRFDSLRLSLS